MGCAAVVYVDVDGVLCPLPSPRRGAPGWRFGSGVAWRPEVAARLAALPAELVWASTWGAEANTVLAPLFGWPQRPVLGRRSSALWWKLAALLADHPRGVPFVWVDDELDQRAAAMGRDRFTSRLEALGAPSLLVCPDPTEGLSGQDLDRIERFVATAADR
jgi:hypothetical protein